MTAPRLDLAELRRLWTICDDSQDRTDWMNFADLAHRTLPALLDLAEAELAVSKNGCVFLCVPGSCDECDALRAAIERTRPLSAATPQGEETK